MKSFTNAALDEFVASIDHELVMAQVIVRRESRGFSLRHVLDQSVAPGALRSCPLPEVRALAQRSAQAAKETAGKIEDSVAKSTDGVAISADVARHFETIQQQVRQLDTLVAEIATASSEQSSGLAQLNNAVSGMEKITQQNAAAAEQSAASASELSAHADDISGVVGDLLRRVGGKRERDSHGLPGKPMPNGRRKQDRAEQRQTGAESGRPAASPATAELAANFRN